MQLRKLSDGMFRIEGRTSGSVFGKGHRMAWSARAESAGGMPELVIEVTWDVLPDASGATPTATVRTIRVGLSKLEVSDQTAQLGQP